MENPIITLSIAMMIFGMLALVGVFNQLGPIRTQEGMKKLGWTMIVLGVLVALTQSEPTRASTSETTSSRAP